MSRQWRPTAWVLTVAMAVNSCWVPQAQSKDLFQMLFHMRRPEGAPDRTVERLAEEIDWLEKHVDAYGSVVAKHPDVWGQAR